MAANHFVNVNFAGIVFVDHFHGLGDESLADLVQLLVRKAE